MFLITKVLVNHPQLLGRGIAADMPSVSQVLLKDLPVKQLSSEQIFLRDLYLVPVTLLGLEWPSKSYIRSS